MNRGVKLRDGFVLYPDEFYKPTYRISPFSTHDIELNRVKSTVLNSMNIVDFLDRKFGRERKWIFTETGKEAIHLALFKLALKTTDCVSIITTSQNKYISRCVTQEIEKFCGWSRQIEKNTAAVFVNHEFGHPHREMSHLKSLGFPLIEDACHSFLADTASKDLGTSDFTIFSLPKVFPIQMGGILSYAGDFTIHSTVDRQPALKSYLAQMTSLYLPELDTAAELRRGNFLKLGQLFLEFGFRPRFELLEHDVPGAYLFTTPPSLDLPKLKEFGWRHGIECSVFYGENAFFIPCHQHLTETDLLYFKTVFKEFIETQAIHGAY